MSESIRFDDGAAYERYMGSWSRMVGENFLDWVAPARGLRWLDVGCGNGAFTEMLIRRVAPLSVDGIDPSAEQLEYARARSELAVARFHQADAMALPFEDDIFDAAVMPLVIFFVPEPSRGIAEMVRVVSPGGIVAAYAWDMAGGGFPYELLCEEMRAMGIPVPALPCADASRADVLGGLWEGAGLDGVETRAITVRRSFADFEEYWATVLCGPNVGRQLRALGQADLAVLKTRMTAALPADLDGRITCSARANAVKGRN